MDEAKLSKSLEEGAVLDRLEWINGLPAQVTIFQDEITGEICKRVVMEDGCTSVTFYKRGTDTCTLLSLH